MRQFWEGKKIVPLFCATALSLELGKYFFFLYNISDASYKQQGWHEIA